MILYKNKIEKRLISLVCLALPFTGILGIDATIGIPFYISMFLILLSVNKVYFIKDDFYMISMFSLLLLSTLINYDKSTISSLFYIIGFMISFFIYQKVIFGYYHKYRVQILKMIFITTMIFCIYVIYEFITRNFIPNLFFDFPRTSLQYYNSIFIGKYIRARGFIEESGHAALFLEFSIPISMYYLTKYSNKNLKYLFIVISLIALFFINSSINIVFIVLFFTFIFIKTILSKDIKKWISMIICIFIVNSVIYTNKDIKNSLYQLINKANITNSASYDISSRARIDNLSTSIEVIKKNVVIGIGAHNLEPYLTHADTSYSIIIDIFVYGGIFSVVLLIIYVVNKFRYILLINNDVKFYLIASLSMLIIHYNIITNFWYPWIWALFGIIDGEYYFEKIK